MTFLFIFSNTFYSEKIIFKLIKYGTSGTESMMFIIIIMQCYNVLKNTVIWICQSIWECNFCLCSMLLLVLEKKIKKNKK